MNEGWFTKRYMWLSEQLDRTYGWDRLPKPLALFTLIGIRVKLRRENLYDTTGVEVGWGPEAPMPGRSLARSADGTGTDPVHPEMGAAYTRFGHNVPIETTYPHDVLEPNPRVVSRDLLARKEFIPAPSVNLLVAAWLQFEVHDWMSHGANQKEDPYEVDARRRRPVVRASDADPPHPGGSDVRRWAADVPEHRDPLVGRVPGVRQQPGGRGVAAHALGWARQAVPGRDHPLRPTVDARGARRRHGRDEGELVARARHAPHVVHAGAQRDLRSPRPVLPAPGRRAALRPRAPDQCRPDRQDPHRRVDHRDPGRLDHGNGHARQLVGRAGREVPGSLRSPHQERGVQRHPRLGSLLPRRAVRDDGGVRRRLPHAPVDPRRLQPPLGGRRHNRRRAAVPADRRHVHARRAARSTTRRGRLLLLVRHEQPGRDRAPQLPEPPPRVRARPTAIPSTWPRSTSCGTGSAGCRATTSSGASST